MEGIEKGFHGSGILSIDMYKMLDTKIKGSTEMQVDLQNNLVQYPSF